MVLRAKFCHRTEYRQNVIRNCVSKKLETLLGIKFSESENRIPMGTLIGCKILRDFN